ncbi:glutaminyl-peptide cyclotransferase-like, partial [Physella acuta]|uniref:glutaminyl-peptide cyclotransferase-like n=1 Tax=Physella acuta TaxID=109671 RepID=UPI0027DCFB0A
MFARLAERPAQDCSPWLSNQNLQRLTNSATNLTHIFHHLLPNILISRVSGSHGNVMVRQFIKQEMDGMGWYVEEDSFQDQTPYGEIAFTNVIATLDPSKAKRVVLACHYDSKLMPGFVGATDSAVPCSLMIETARWFQQVPDDVWNNA